MAFEIAVPEEDNRTFSDYLDALKRRRKPALIIAATILLLGGLAIFLWPNSYTSSAVILIEDPDVPPGLVPSTVTTFASRQVQYINQRVMTRTNLANIIEKYNLYPDERKYLPTLLLVPDVQKDMKIDIIDVQSDDPRTGRPMSSTIAFTLGFRHEHPETARMVANELVSLYLAENVRSRTEQTAETSQFMKVEVDRLDAQVKELEQEIATIKQANEGALPELVNFNMQVMNSLDMEIREINRQIQSIQENKIMLDAELAKLNPIATTVLPDGSPVMAPEDQLKGLQTRLAMLEGRYSPDHPDVLRTRRDLTAIQEQLGVSMDVSQAGEALTVARSDLAMARERYNPEHPEVQRLQRLVTSLENRPNAPSRGPSGLGSLKADNPVYIQMRAQRESLESSERALRAKQTQAQARRAELERNTLKSSDVERELSALYRRLQSATLSYQGARDRLFTAQMGQALETQAKGERFTLVEPADLPLLPSSPNRPVLLALLIVLVLAAGLGWPQIAESMDQSITSARAVERVQGAPPIAEIPRIETTEDRVHSRNVKLGALVVAPAALLVVLLLIHFLWINLDVAWYVFMRRFGL